MSSIFAVPVASRRLTASHKYIQRLDSSQKLFFISQILLDSILKLRLLSIIDFFNPVPVDLPFEQAKNVPKEQDETSQVTVIRITYAFGMQEYFHPGTQFLSQR